MIRIFLQLCILVFLFGCQENNESNTTEIITDSYFFQKNSFNVNLYSCNQPQTRSYEKFGIEGLREDFRYKHH